MKAHFNFSEQAPVYWSKRLYNRYKATSSKFLFASFILPTKPVVQSFFLTKVKTGWCNKKLLSCKQHRGWNTACERCLWNSIHHESSKNRSKVKTCLSWEKVRNSYCSLKSPASGHRGCILDSLLNKNRDISASKIKQHDVAHNYTAEFSPTKWGLHPKLATLGTCHVLNHTQTLSRRAPAGMNQNSIRDALTIKHHIWLQDSISV